MDKSVLRKISYGLYAIGVMDGDRPCGCIVNTVFQITSDGVIALSMNHDNYTHALIERGGRFSVSILSESTPASAIGALGFASGRDKDKYQGLSYSFKDGLPILDGHPSGYLMCEVVGSSDTSTHRVFFARVTDAFPGTGGPAMTYDYYHRVVKGSAPKNAPTYQEPVAEKKEEPQLRYECSVCHYIYEGDITKEPDDFVCPICGVSKNLFQKVEG